MKNYIPTYEDFVNESRVNEGKANIKKGSIVIPFASSDGEFIVDTVFKNKDGEVSYTGKFKKTRKKMEYILHKDDKIIKESVVNEAEKFKSTKDFLDFCEEIDGMPENRIRRIMGNKYIDTPGGYRDEAEDYDNDIVEYMISNMGRKEFEKLKSYWETNIKESTTFVTESAMGDVHIMAEEAATFDEFKAEFIKEYGIGKKDNNKELHNWLQEIWKENHKK